MRLKILGGDEIDALYAHPRFTHEDRVEHFALSPAEVAALEQLHSIKSKIFFILQLGYFKARHMFFVFDLREVEDDVGYIRERYFPDTDQVDPTIAKGTRLKQQRLILELCNYRAWNTEEQKKLAARSRQAATVSGKPIYIFRELTHYLLENRIVAPGYSLMQDTVGGALAYDLGGGVDLPIAPFFAWRFSADRLTAPTRSPSGGDQARFNTGLVFRF